MKRILLITLLILWLPREDNLPSVSANGTHNAIKIDYHADKIRYWRLNKAAMQQLNQTYEDDKPKEYVSQAH